MGADLSQGWDRCPGGSDTSLRSNGRDRCSRQTPYAADRAPRSSGPRWLVTEEGRAPWGRTQHQDGCPTSFVINMSHSENKGRHHVWERWSQMQLGKGWEEVECTQATYPH